MGQPTTGRRSSQAPDGDDCPAQPTPAGEAPPEHDEHGLVLQDDLESQPQKKERATDDGDTAITIYLREIGQVRLLTPTEEIKLAARIKAGDGAAREHMIKANLRLVVKIARDYEGLGLASAGSHQRGQYRPNEGRGTL